MQNFKAVQGLPDSGSFKCLTFIGTRYCNLMNARLVSFEKFEFQQKWAFFVKKLLFNRV